MIQFSLLLWNSSASSKSRRINVSRINAIKNSNGDKVSPWKISLLILRSPSNSPWDVNSTHQFSIVSLRRFLTILALWRSLNILWSMDVEPYRMLYDHLFTSLSTILSMKIWLYVPLVSRLHPFCSALNAPVLSNDSLI